MTKLKVNFVDFWNGFSKKENYFYHLLSKKYDVEIDEEDPDILFFSVDYSLKRESLKYSNHRCLKIFFTGESVDPNYSQDDPISISNFGANYSIARCDISFSFRPDTDRNMRLPLWALHIDWFNVGSYGDNPSFLIPIDDLESNRFIEYPKSKFCAAVFSNPTKERLSLVNKISGYSKVDCYGSPFGNHSHGELSKMEVLKNYKFSLCPENRIEEGYFTEKLFHAKISGTVPIYGYNKKDNFDFNENCFINILDFQSPDELVSHIKEMDTHESYDNIRKERLFKSKDCYMKFSPDRVIKFLEGFGI